MERAKEMFLQYCGNRYYMALDGEEQVYNSYRVSKETEEAWRREYLTRFFDAKRTGKKALGAYEKAVTFLKSDRSDGNGEAFLHYPLRASGLDDVTVLFMLRGSFRLAEKWAGKGKLSREEVDSYLSAFDGFSRSVLERAEKGTLTRAAEYVMGEFADPLYIADYLDDLRKSWRKLL